MAGGYRPGAGRPRKSAKRKAKGAQGANAGPSGVAVPVGPGARADMTPLEYMLAVLRDPGADSARRDRMAIAAAPFCHTRVSDGRLSQNDEPNTDSPLGELMARRLKPN